MGKPFLAIEEQIELLERRGLSLRMSLTRIFTRHARYLLVVLETTWRPERNPLALHGGRAQRTGGIDPQYYWYQN